MHIYMHTNFPDKKTPKCTPSAGASLFDCMFALMLFVRNSCICACVHEFVVCICLGTCACVMYACACIHVDHLPSDGEVEGDTL